MISVVSAHQAERTYLFLLFPLLIIGGIEEQKVSSLRKKEDKKTPHNAALTMG